MSRPVHTSYKTWSQAILGVCTFFCVASKLSAQVAGDSARTSRNTFYVSAGGQGVLYSVNFDRAWYIGKSKMSVSIGGGYIPVIEPEASSSTLAPKISVPVQWNWFHGERSMMEHGLGLSMLSGWNAVGDADETGRAHSTSLTAFLKPIGYRYQANGNGIFIRAYALVAFKLIEFNPAWKELLATHPEYDYNIFPWVGLDIGYSFKSSKK